MLIIDGGAVTLAMGWKGEGRIVRGGAAAESFFSKYQVAQECG